MPRNVSPCLPACLPACLLACLPACLLQACMLLYIGPYVGPRTVRTVPLCLLCSCPTARSCPCCLRACVPACLRPCVPRQAHTPLMEPMPTCRAFLPVYLPCLPACAGLQACMLAQAIRTVAPCLP